MSTPRMNRQSFRGRPRLVREKQAASASTGQYPTEGRATVPMAYVRQVHLQASLSDAEVLAYWKFFLEEAIAVAISV